MRLENKTAIITGGGTGIGLACAELFTREGAQVVLFGRRPEPLEAAVRKVGVLGTSVSGDITKNEDVDRLVDHTMEMHGRIDILVNNAGTYMGGPLHEMEEDHWDRVMDINLRGVFLVTRNVLKQMVKQESGSLIHISSTLGLVAVPQTGAYNASKGAMNQFSRSIAVEYGPLGIRSNAICPAMVETEMTDGLRQNADLMEEWKKYYYPMGRFAQPDEVAQACLFFASDESSFITGTLLPVDGGFTAL